jgi:hypothetical protein
MDFEGIKAGIITGFITSCLAAIILVKYSQNELKRNQLNWGIDLLFDEIQFNREKLPKYYPRFLEVKRKYEKENTWEWINRNEISTGGYGGFLHSYFSFDKYNLFINSGLNLFLDKETDYSLKLFYHNCKSFCAKTQFIEGEIHQLHRVKQNAINIEKKGEIEKLITGKWSEIEGEINSITKIFDSYSHFKLENKEKLKKSWKEWHWNMTWKGYTVSEWFRIAFGIGLMGYVAWCGLLVVFVQDLQWKTIFLGLGFTILGVGYTFISSVKSDRGMREIKEKLSKILNDK